MLEIAALLITLNSVTALMFWWDKRQAVLGERRVPERVLLLLAAMGRSAGAVFAQQVLRHKTRKQPFRSILQGIIVLQIVALAVVLIEPWRW